MASRSGCVPTTQSGFRNPPGNARVPFVMGVTVGLCGGSLHLRLWAPVYVGWHECAGSYDLA